MKKIYFLSSLLLCAASMSAQTMIVLDKSGEQHRFGVNRIEQITFDEIEDEPDPDLIDYTAVTVSPYSGGNVGMTFTDAEGKNIINLDMWGTTEATYLEAGTYTVNAMNNQWTIDPSYSYFMPEAGQTPDYIGAGQVTVTDNEGVYTIDIAVRTASGLDINGRFTGELPSYTSHPKAMEIVLTSATKKIINDPQPGEHYIKLNDAPWDYEMTLDFFADESSTNLPAGTYTIDRSDAHPAGTLYYQKSSIDIYTGPSSDRGNHRFSDGTVTVTVNGNIHTIEMNVTLDNGREAHITYSGEITIETE